MFEIISSINVDPTKKTQNYIVSFRIFFKDDTFRKRLHNIYRNSTKFIVYGFYGRLWIRIFNPEKPFFVKFRWTLFHNKFDHIDTLFFSNDARYSTREFHFRKYEEATMFLEALTERVHDLIMHEYDDFLRLKAIQDEVKQAMSK